MLEVAVLIGETVFGLLLAVGLLLIPVSTVLVASWVDGRLSRGIFSQFALVAVEESGVEPIEGVPSPSELVSGLHVDISGDWWSRYIRWEHP